MSEKSAKKGQNMTPSVKKLGDICQIKPPKKIAKEKLSETDLVSFFPMADLEAFNYYISPKSTKKLSEVYSGYVFFEDNDVLLAKITPCFENGKLGIAKNLMNGIGFGSSEYHVFRISEESIPEYIYYFLSLNNIREEGKNRMTGAVGHKRIPNDYLLDLDILVPSIPEQKQIVSILDKSFAAIDKAKANAEQNLQNARELFESYLQDVFENKGDDWEEKTIKEITSLVTKGSSPKWQGINYVEDGGIFFLTSKNVGEGELLLSNKKYLEEGFNSIQKTSILAKGDVLTNIVGASIGRTAIFDLDEITNINQAVCLMRCQEEKVYNYYLMYLLNSPFFKTILHDNEVDNARANLSLTFFKNLIIPLPTVSKQIEIVEEIRQVSIQTKKLQSIYTQKIAELDELKKSILQKAFSGQLTTN